MPRSHAPRVTTMIFSRTTQYTAQALIYIVAQPADRPILNQTIAETLGVPPAYLAKVLQQLVRAGLLDSTRGRSGGFRATAATRKANLMQVLTLIEGPGLTESCVLGLKTCSDEHGCPMHATWKPIKSRIISLLTDHTLEKLARAVMSGRYQIGELPAALLRGEAVPAPRRTARAAKAPKAAKGPVAKPIRIVRAAKAAKPARAAR